MRFTAFVLSINLIPVRARQTIPAKASRPWRATHTLFHTPKAIPTEPLT